MLWFILLAFFVVLIVAFAFASKASRHSDNDWYIGSIFCAVIVLIIMTIGSGVFYGRQLSTDGAMTRLEQTKYQRDQLVDLIHSELSAEQYNALLAFTDADQMKIFFKTTGESDVLITRAMAVVKYNNDLLQDYNSILDNQISLCNAKRNWMIPLFPGVVDCKIDLVKELDERINVYSGS